jgi:hypothetical protein
MQILLKYPAFNILIRESSQEISEERVQVVDAIRAHVFLCPIKNKLGKVLEPLYGGSLIEALSNASNHLVNQTQVLLN